MEALYRSRRPVHAYRLSRRQVVLDLGWGGVAGTADAIGSALQAAGASWDSVTDIILTHHHADHAGSLSDVVARAAQAGVHAGPADIDNLTANTPGVRTIAAAVDGADIFGMQVVATPGHTEGHISVFDRSIRVLVAGDALGNTAGLSGSKPQYTANPSQAAESVRTLAALDAGTILFGHGEPLTAGAALALRTYAGSR
jgi:glyoxylase-like metal-dependent hydrolase (beta-lactamase superfamily II)